MFKNVLGIHISSGVAAVPRKLLGIAELKRKPALKIAQSVVSWRDYSFWMGEYGKIGSPDKACNGNTHFLCK